MGIKRKEREGELPSAVSQMAARDRAIRQKRREIDEVENMNTLTPWENMGRGEIREAEIRERMTGGEIRKHQGT